MKKVFFKSSLRHHAIKCIDPNLEGGQKMADSIRLEHELHSDSDEINEDVAHPLLPNEFLKSLPVSSSAPDEKKIIETNIREYFWVR